MDPSRPGAAIANKIQQQINSTDSQNWDAEKKELAGYVVVVFVNESRKQRYDQASQSSFSPPKVTTDFLADLTATRSSHGLDALRQGGANAPRGHSTVGDVIPTVPSESHNSATTRTITTTSTPMQPLAPKATLKDVQVCIPKAIQAVIMMLAELAAFRISNGVLTFVQSLEYFESSWSIFLKAVINIFSWVIILGTTVMTLISGFISSGIYRRLKIGPLLIAALVPGLNLTNDAMIFAIDVPSFAFDCHFGFYYWWKFTYYLVLSVPALILCPPPQSLMRYRGMTLAKTTSQSSQPETIPSLVESGIRHFSTPFGIVNVQRQRVRASFILFASGFEIQSRKSLQRSLGTF